jgi:LmbE family N-acetylglucosaminyl deacetylase
MNEDKILGKKILIITAHPDDETFTSAGTIYRNNQMGGSTIAICATLGEKGKSHLEQEMPDNELAEVRRQELLNTLEFLGVSRDNIHTFTFPDKEVKEFFESVREEILPLVKSAHADMVISFDEYGLTGHEDHIAVGKIAKSIAAELGLPLATFTLPPKLLEEDPELFKKRAKYGKYTEHSELKEPNVVINIDKDVKDKALCFHKSQFGVSNPLKDYSKALADCVLSKEYFFLED